MTVAANTDRILLIVGTIAIVVGIALLPEADLVAASAVLISVGVAAVVVGLVLRRRRPPEKHRPLDAHPGVDNPAIIVHHDYGDLGAGAGGDGGGGGGGD
ncbi:hypothetical protein [Microcella sp.]|uniref:hypothetical protein n=1 Tax=Microcella sp. TaxID=1913979 RepID=UPI003F70D5CB